MTQGLNWRDMSFEEAKPDRRASRGGVDPTSNIDPAKC